jgi:hypothetical protein
MPFDPTGPSRTGVKMAVLLFRLHPIANSNSFSFRHWAEVGALRCHHPIRQCLIIFGRLRAELQRDRPAGAPFALDETNSSRLNFWESSDALPATKTNPSRVAILS